MTGSCASAQRLRCGLSQNGHHWVQTSMACGATGSWLTPQAFDPPRNHVANWGCRVGGPHSLAKLVSITRVTTGDGRCNHSKWLTNRLIARGYRFRLPCPKLLETWGNEGCKQAIDDGVHLAWSILDARIYALPVPLGQLSIIVIDQWVAQLIHNLIRAELPQTNSGVALWGLYWFIQKTAISMMVNNMDVVFFQLWLLPTTKCYFETSIMLTIAVGVYHQTVIVVDMATTVAITLRNYK